METLRVWVAHVENPCMPTYCTPELSNRWWDSLLSTLPVNITRPEDYAQISCVLRFRRNRTGSSTITLNCQFLCGGPFRAALFFFGAPLCLLLVT